MALLWAADLRVCERRVVCTGEVAERFRGTASQWVCLGLAAMLPLPVTGGRFEDEDEGRVVPLSKGNARPSMARQFLAMLPAAAGLPSSGLLALVRVKHMLRVPKGCVRGACMAASE